jgi:hypothetical protein
MSRRETKFYLKAITIGLFLFLLIGYGIFEIWNYATGPKIIVHFPTNGTAVAESLITINGGSKNTKLITLNNRPIVIDRDGNFSEKILLAYGYNELVLKAEDRFGKKTETSLKIVYK